MKNDLLSVPAFVILFGAVVLVAAVVDDALAKEIPVDELPPAVRATIEEHAKGDSIEEVELEEEDGRLVYNVELHQEDRETEFMVSVRGEFLGYEDDDEEPEHVDDLDGKEEETSLDQLPAAAREVAATIVSGNAVTRVTREHEDNVILFEVEYLMDGEQHSIELSESGDLLETERVIRPEELPHAVRKELDEEFPAASLGEICATRIYLYEIEVIGGNGKRREVKLLATGEEFDED